MKKIGERTPCGHVITEHDWIEDFSHENGNYQCKCMFCEETFIGHKRRVVCKKCANEHGLSGTAEVAYNLEDAIKIIKTQ